MNPYNLQESYYEMYEEKYEPDPFGRPGGKYGGVPKPGSGYDRAWKANLKALEKLEKKNQKESVDLYDLILSHLIDEGYADSYKDANTMMAHMSEDWYNDIVETALDEGFVELTPEKQKRVERHLGTLTSKAREQKRKLEGSIEKYKKRKANPVTRFLLGTRGPQQEVAKGAKELKKTKRHLETSMDAIGRSQAGRMASIQYKRNQVAQKLRELGVDPDAAKKAKSNIKPFKRSTQNESYYAYDLILLHLLDEGYADSYEQADSIIESMSGDWMIDILQS